MNPEQIERRLQKLEEVTTHQEHIVQQLNEVVIQLRGEQDRLKMRLQQQLDRIDGLLESQANPLDPNERPPHY